MKFPSEGLFAPTHLSTLSGTAAINAMLGQVVTVAGITWVANLAVYIPIIVPTEFLVRRLFVIQGTSASAANQDVGLYSEDGVRLASSGSTAKSGSTIQYTTLGTPLLLTPGRYYLAYANDTNNTLAVRAPTAAAVIQDAGRLAGVLEEASAFPLPAAMTPVALAHQFYPYVGMTSTT